MNLKNIVKIFILLIIALGAAWFYLNNNTTENNPSDNNNNIAEVSYRFQGLATAVREDNLAIFGDYMLQDDINPIVINNKTVTVFINEDTTILRRIIEPTPIVDGEFDFGTENNAIDTLPSEAVSLDDLKKDVEEFNPVLTVGAYEDIFGQEAFYALNIEYIIISSQ
ncbi:MAG: hypothetical protein Q8P83_00105 [bacterium]|nr:hypothetical protein [bacterium]